MTQPQTSGARPLGITGANRQSWRAGTPRQLLEKIVQAAPGAGYSELLETFTEKVKERPDLLDVVIEYWFTHNYRSLQNATQDLALARAKAEHRERTKAKANAEVNDLVKKAVRHKARVMLMDLMMPNGKRLRACTGKECLDLSKSVGRWLAAVGHEIKPSQKVGEAISEDRLHELWDAI